MTSGFSCIDFVSASGSWHLRAVTQSLWYCEQLELHYCLLEQLVSLCFPRGFDFDYCAVSTLVMILAKQVGPVLVATILLLDESRDFLGRSGF